MELCYIKSLSLDIRLQLWNYEKGILKAFSDEEKGILHIVNYAK